MRAAIERHAEARGLGDAAAADPRRRLDHGEAAAGGRQPARGRDAGGAGADDDDIDLVPTARRGLAPAGGRERWPNAGCRRHCGKAGQHTPSGPSFHGLQLVLTLHCNVLIFARSCRHAANVMANIRLLPAAQP